MKREDLRQTMNEMKKNDKKCDKIDSENSDYILKQINDLKIIIETKLTNFDENQEKSEIEKFLKDLDFEYERLNKFINDSSLYLAKYNLKSTQNILNSIRVKIDFKKDLLNPKSKFSFKSSFKANPKLVKTEPESLDETDSSKSMIQLTPFFGFKNIINCDKPLRLSSEESFGKDLQLDGLENCQIEIKGAPNTLKVNNLLNCKIFCGPTTTSIFISNCKKCVFKMAAQQIRIHSTFETDFYIHVTSRAIIEDSANIRFAPFDWTYDKIDDDFKIANLDINTNNWKLIDDFDSLTDKPSNNWSFIDSN